MKKIKQISGVKKISKQEQQKIHGGVISGGCNSPEGSCLNGGTCTSAGGPLNITFCTCSARFTGSRCERRIRPL